MSNYIIKKEEKEKKIIKVLAQNYYTFTPKSKTKESVTYITIYDYDKISKIIVKKLMIKYQKLLNMLSSLNGEDDPSGFTACLDELDKLYEMLEFKYKKYLKQELYNKFIEDLSNIKEFIVLGLEKKNTIER